VVRHKEQHRTERIGWLRASVSSQADTENAGLASERQGPATDGYFELAELTAIYVERGWDESLAR
jgi:hypothetical protein